MAEQEKIVCPRCGVEQIRRDKCVVCGYEFGEDEQAKAKQRKEKIFSPPQKKKASKQGSTKQRAVRGSSSIVLVGVEGTKDLLLSPSVKLVLLVVVLVGALVGFNRYSLSKDLNELKSTLVNLRCPEALQAAADRDELKEQIASCAKRKVVAELLLKGHDIDAEGMQVDVDELDSTVAARFGLTPDDQTKLGVRVSGKFRFRWLGVYWDTVRFDLLGYADVTGFTPKPPKPSAPEALERNVLTVPNTLQ